MSDFMTLARERMSVRKYADRPVEQEKLEQVLEAGRLAPTAKNNQPQRIYVVRSEKALAALRGVTHMTFDAPVVLVVCYDEGEVWHNGLEKWRDYDSGEQDCAIIADHMQLMATELGLGTLWARAFDARAVAEALDIPESSKPVLLLSMGYAADGYTANPRHDSRKPLSETVIEL